MKSNLTTICYPRGSGGNWLGNLIRRLETGQFELPTVDVIFDNQPQSDSFRLSHVFNLFDGQSLTFDSINNTDLIKFSSPCWFNQYINDAVKVRYKIFKLGNKSILEQFHVLTDSAVYIRTDQLWQTTWGDPGQLEYSLIYQDPEKFIDQLFLKLDQNNIKYTPDREYCRTSISYYKSTCPSPTQQLNNFDSLLWLAWCHSELLITGIPLSITIPADATVQSIRYIIEPLITLQFVELTKTTTAQETT